MTIQCPKCHKELFVESQDAASINECPFCGFQLNSENKPSVVEPKAKEQSAKPSNVTNRWQAWLVVKQVLSVVFGAWMGLVALIVVLKLKWFGDATPFVMIGGLCGGGLFFTIAAVVNQCHEQYFVSSKEKLKRIQSAVEQSKKDYRADRTYFDEHREEYVICKNCGNVFERGGVVDGVCRFVGTGIAGIIKYIVITICLLLVSWFVNLWLFLCVLAICALGVIPYLFKVISSATHSYSTNAWTCPECGSHDVVPCNSFLGEKLVAERLKPFAKQDKELGIATGEVNSESSNTTSVKERLSALDELKRERMITDEEYDQKRSEILKTI